MSFTVFGYNARLLLIQPDPTQPMDGPNPCPSLSEPLSMHFWSASHARAPCDRCGLQLHVSHVAWSFCYQIVNVWNSSPDYVVEADSVNSFKSRLDKYWANQEFDFKFNSELTGTGGLPVCMQWYKMIRMYGMQMRAQRIHLSPFTLIVLSCASVLNTRKLCKNG